MRKPLKPKSEIIDDLSKIFRAHGFEGATLTLLTQGSGLERASLYHHFPNGKADMAEAVLLNALEQLDAQVINDLREKGNPSRKLDRMLSAVEEFYKNGNEVCFITIFSLSFVSRKVTEATHRALSEWIKLLSKTLRDLDVSDPKELAQQILSTIQGSLVLSQAMGDSRIFKNSLKRVRASF